MKAQILLALLAASVAVHAARERGWTPSNPRGSRHRVASKVDVPKPEAKTEEVKPEVKDMRAIEKDAIEFLQEFDRLSALQDNKQVLAEWAYESNITDFNLQNKVRIYEHQYRKPMVVLSCCIISFTLFRSFSAQGFTHFFSFSFLHLNEARFEEQ